MGIGYWQTSRMHRGEKPTPRQILSANLRSLMDERPDLGTIKKIVSSSGSKLSNGKVGRIYAASHTTDIDTLAHLAEVFGVHPWQLLVEDLNPKALPQLADLSLLSRIQQLVSSTQEKPSPVAVAAELQQDTAGPTKGIGPALKEALVTEGTDTYARSKARAVQKQKGRRRS